jgi:hypothetical protein
VAAAKKAGGSDNITVVMVSCWLPRVCGKKFLVGKWGSGEMGIMNYELWSGEVGEFQLKP